MVERYAIATVRGLKLLQPEAIDHADLNTLLAGLSFPGPVVDELPAWWVDALVQQNRRALQSPAAATGQRGVSVSVRGTFPAGAGGDTPEPLRAARAEKIAALVLPGVAEEIDQLFR